MFLDVSHMPAAFNEDSSRKMPWMMRCCVFLAYVFEPRLPASGTNSEAELEG